MRRPTALAVLGGWLGLAGCAGVDHQAFSPEEPAYQASRRAGLADIKTRAAAPPVTTPLPPCPPEEEPAGVLPIDLASAMNRVGGRVPAVGRALARVREAYADLDAAKVLWLPSLRAGVHFHKHDGNYQASDGSVIDINRNSFQGGLGVLATGAGTTPRPGLVAEFAVADAVFQPQVAEKTAWARGHAADAVFNRQLLDAGLAYFELLRAAQGVRILEESRGRTQGLAKLTGDFAESGEGLRADADRLTTEVGLVEARLAEAREASEVAAAALAQALSLDPTARLTPADAAAVPLALTPTLLPKAELIALGLTNRPELKEAQSLVAAAKAEHRRQRLAPFVPSVLLGYSVGGFGGGLGNRLDDVEGRYDFDAALAWEVRNFGFGEAAARRRARARVHRAEFDAVRTMDRVAREVSEARGRVTHRRRRVEVTRKAIESARRSYDRNLSRIKDGEGLPLEVLQSVRALEDAQRAYLSAVVAYNRAQMRLLWATGWPALPRSPVRLGVSESHKAVEARPMGGNTTARPVRRLGVAPSR